METAGLHVAMPAADMVNTADGLWGPGVMDTTQRAQILREFLAHVRHELRVDAKGAQRYRVWCERWHAWCDAHGIRVDRARWVDVGDFLSALADGAFGRPYKPATVAVAHSTLHAYYTYLIREDLCQANPVALLKRPKIPKELPRVPTPAEMHQLLDAIPTRRPKDLRDKAMLELLYACGLRVSELCGLDLSDLDLREGTAIVRGKGAKERLVYLTAPAQDALRDYLWSARNSFVARCKDPQQSHAVFFGAWGRRISRSMVGQAVRQWARIAGLERRIWPHLIRHAFGTHMIEADVGINDVRILMGHDQLNTTLLYVRTARRTQLRQTVLGAHPRQAAARLRGAVVPIVSARPEPERRAHGHPPRVRQLIPRHAR